MIRDFGDKEGYFLIKTAGNQCRVYPYASLEELNAELSELDPNEHDGYYSLFVIKGRALSIEQVPQRVVGEHFIVKE